MSFQPDLKEWIPDYPWRETPLPALPVIKKNTSFPDRGLEIRPVETREITEFRELLRSRALGILMQHHLPDYGESRFWVNPAIPELQPVNAENPQFSIVTWNIFRGFKLAEQIKFLRKIELPGILCLQEADWHCMRTSNRNIALEMARALGYKYVTFSTSFIEVDRENYQDHLNDFPNSKRRKEHLGRGGGVIGNAVLSNYPIVGLAVMKLPQVYDYENPNNFFAKVCPAVGGRIAQKIRIKLGDRDVVIYNAHLETLSGPLGRFKQYVEIKHDAEAEDNPVIQVGDFNTCGHGLASRFSEESRHSLRHCFRPTPVASDPLMRFKRFGETEAELWQRMEFFGGPNNRKRFKDPFSPRNKTFKISPFFGAKLDWTLFEEGRFSLIHKETGPYDLSDHRPLMVWVQLV